jgi:hypothetical protein
VTCQCKRNENEHENDTSRRYQRRAPADWFYPTYRPVAQDRSAAAPISYGCTRITELPRRLLTQDSGLPPPRFAKLLLRVVPPSLRSSVSLRPPLLPPPCSTCHVPLLYTRRLTRVHQLHVTSARRNWTDDVGRTPCFAHPPLSNLHFAKLILNMVLVPSVQWKLLLYAYAYAYVSVSVSSVSATRFVCFQAAAAAAA